MEMEVAMSKDINSSGAVQGKGKRRPDPRVDRYGGKAWSMEGQPSFDPNPKKGKGFRSGKPPSKKAGS